MRPIISLILKFYGEKVINVGVLPREVLENLLSVVRINDYRTPY